MEVLREEARQAELWRQKVLLWAAVKIQSFFRGCKGRVYFEQQLREKRGMWIELFDEETERRFFYSKLTGEIRWNIPADLLALIPRPKCDNCAYYEAHVECSNCNEVFCRSCFDQVHYGGRRKEHEFRCMYDYYDNRVDYGDGVYPSKWPSEVIQDEIQGWMLRVAPIRQPLETWGMWEIYESECVGESMENVERRRFFFNRETFEATYEAPLELAPLGLRQPSSEGGHSLEWDVSNFGQLEDSTLEDGPSSSHSRISSQVAGSSKYSVVAEELDASK